MVLLAPKAAAAGSLPVPDFALGWSVSDVILFFERRVASVDTVKHGQNICDLLLFPLR